MTNLTSEQRRRVAEATTGKEWIVCTFGPNGGGIPYVADKENPCVEPFWDPSRWPSQWKELARWLASRNLRDGHASADTTYFHLAIATDNTDALEQLAFEIIDARVVKV